MLKILTLIVSVIWILIVLGIASLIAVLSALPFFAPPLNWLLILSPAIPLGAFYGLDRHAE